ncbi:MAG: hypothetical protein RLZZ136_1699 [Pseudomonadota bacterium]
MLSSEEAALWARVAATIVPIKGRRHPPVEAASPADLPKVPPKPSQRAVKQSAAPIAAPVATARASDGKRVLDRHGLDAGWDQRLGKGAIAPDFTLDLHGHSLDAAWSRLVHGLAKASALGARVVLVITGKPLPVDAADRGRQRGAIRAKLLDWLALGSHASKIAAVRGAHPHHGGAVYVVLKRVR